MARCKHCDKFILIKRNSGYCKGCKDYLKAESIKRQAQVAEVPGLRQEAEEARRLEEARKQAEEAERIRLAEEAHFRQDAEETRRLEEDHKQAEEAERIRLAEEARFRQDAEEARRLEEERKQAEEAERIRLAEEARLRQEAEEAQKMERDRLQAVQWIYQLKQEQEESLLLESAEEPVQKEKFLHHEIAREQLRLQHEADEKVRLEKEHHQVEELARLRMILNPKEHLKEQTETLLREIAKDQPDLYVVPRKSSTTIRRRLWNTTANWQYIATVRYTSNALSIAISTRVPEFENAQHMVAIGFVSTELSSSSSEIEDDRLDLFVEAVKADEFFGLLLQPHSVADAEKSCDVLTEIICPEICKDIKIEQLNLSQRAYNRLKRNGIHTLGALCELSEADLCSFSQLGSVTITEILQRRSEYLTKLNDGTHDTSTIKEPIISSTCISNDGQCINVRPEDIDCIPLEQLNLSVRAFNGLSQAGIRTFGDMCKLSEDELFAIKNLGKLSVREILQCRETLRERAVADIHLSDMDTIETLMSPAECPEAGKDIPLERLGLSVRAYNGLSRSGIKTFGELYKLTADELSGIQNLGKLSVKEILECRKNWTKKLLLSEVSAITFELSAEASDAAMPINPPIRSFIDYVQNLSNERTKTVILQRAQGITFEEISVQLNVSRARVQQFEKKFWDRAAWGAESFIEEKYVAILAKYQINEKEFRAIFDEPREVWYIATKLCKRIDEDLLPLEDSILDENISPELRACIQDFCRSITADAFIEIDGNSIPSVRSDVEHYVLSHYCLDEMLIDDFIKKYNEILIDAGYSDEYLLITEAVRHTRYNAIYDSSEVLCSFKRRIRYYPIGNYNIPAFITALNLDSYQDIEISARKLMLDHPALMEEYDIRNEYELHNLLRKQEVDKLVPGMVFGKMPTLRFGDTDRTSFILDLLFDLAPISRDDFAIAVSEITGERPDFILSKIEYWEAINVYLHNDMLTIDYEEMPDQEKQALLASLSEDCYTIEEIQKAYMRVTGNSDIRLLSPYNLKRMGFKVYTGYVVRNHASAKDYFHNLLTEREIVDCSTYAERFSEIRMYYDTLMRLRNSYEVVEFAPYQLVRKDRLEKFGVTIESLRAFCNEVYHFTEPEQYFTIHSLRRTGFDSFLFALGFDDWFYSSILREDTRFENTRVGTYAAPSLIFCRDVDRVSRQSFIEYLLDGGSMDRDDMFTMIQDEYGVVMDKHDIFQILNESNMYYDPTMGKIYADKELYYEEV